MKKLFLTLALLSMAFSLSAQDSGDVAMPEGYQFTDKDCVEVTPVKDQSRSGTCWSFSGTAFLESEILKNGGPVTTSPKCGASATAMRKRLKNSSACTVK